MCNIDDNPPVGSLPVVRRLSDGRIVARPLTLEAAQKQAVLYGSARFVACWSVPRGSGMAGNGDGDSLPIRLPAA